MIPVDTIKQIPKLIKEIYKTKLNSIHFVDAFRAFFIFITKLIASHDFLKKSLAYKKK